MSDIQPFNAIRFTGDRDITTLIAPPYDVLGESDKAGLLKRDEHNIVAVDLPHTPPKSAGPPEAYAAAAVKLRTWLADGVLAHDRAPAVFAYQQTFEHAGRRVVRRGFIARVRAEPFRATPAGIFPHEQTFSGPKEDRLMLTRAARCQLSPIFGLYADEHNAIAHELYANLPPHATMTGRLGEVLHEAWRVDNQRKIAALTAAMRDRPIFIADGHHRYTTALNYLAELDNRGQLPADHPARFVMFVCVSMHDQGLAILPTHRVVTVPEFDLQTYVDRLEGPFEVQRGGWSVESLESEVLSRGQGWFGVRAANADYSLLLRQTDRHLMDRYEALRGEPYRRLDVAVLHRYLIEETLSAIAGEPLGIEYPHSGRDAAAALAVAGVDAATAFGSASSGAAQAGNARASGPAAKQGAGASTKVAFILAPTPLPAVRDVCLSGELMPQKSTFFYPKLATGMTLYDLSE